MARRSLSVSSKMNRSRQRISSNGIPSPRFRSHISGSVSKTGSRHLCRGDSFREDNGPQCYFTVHPPMSKIVSLEDTREVKLPHPNWIPSVTRDSFDTAGRGEINSMNSCVLRCDNGRNISSWRSPWQGMPDPVPGDEHRPCHVLDNPRGFGCQCRSPY